MPDAVQNLRTFNEDSNSIHVKWNAPQNTGVEAYVVSVEPAPQTGSCPGGECFVANTSLVITGLEPCQAYMVDVQVLTCLDIGPTVSAQATTGSIYIYIYIILIILAISIIAACSATL